jgi:general nucleoside transport system permease protein
MAVETQRLEAAYERQFRFNRQFILGIVFILLGIGIFAASLGVDGDITSTLTFPRGGNDAAGEPDILDLEIPTRAYLLFMGVFAAVTGAVAAGTSQNPILDRIGAYMLYASVAFLIPGILVAAAADDSTNAVTMISETLRLATPIAIGAMAGLWCERAGVVNIAIEGMMLFGACFSFTTFFLLRQEYPESTNALLVLSVIVGILTGGIVALLHAWLSITFKINQIVSGTVINILAGGVTSFVRREYLLSTEAGTETLPNIAIPILHDIPVIGEPLFNAKPIFYLMFVLLIGTHIIIFHTRWGLRVRAVGENPHAADTLGINVNRVRWISVFIGGLIAGLAGTWFSMETTGRFSDNMTSGRGFIALAALIFGKWTPGGAFGASLLFGFSSALETRLQILGVNVPSQFLQMLPYIVTIVVLAGLIGRAVGPKAAGTPFEKE